MKTYCIGLLLSLCTVCSLAQGHDYMEAMLNSHHTIRQIEGTNHLLKEYLGMYAKGNKVLFAILFAPQACPRCEVDIDYALENIRKIKPDASLVVIASYPDADAAREYVKSRFRIENIIVDTTGIHERIFHYRTGRLAVTYLLQIDVEQGRLMCGGDSPYMNLDFLKQFCNNTSYVPYVESNQESNALVSGEPRRQEVLQGTYPSVFINCSNGFSISAVMENSEWKGDKFLFADELLSQGILLDIRKDTAFLERMIIPTRSQESAFSRIPASQFNRMKEQGMLFIMASCVAFSPDSGQPIVSYSLPDLSFEKDSSIAYFNKPVLLEALAEGDSCRMDCFDFEHDADTLYMYTHASRIMPLPDGRLLLGCRRGFPTTVTAADCLKNTSQDIFIPSFYENSPICAFFDRSTGKLTGRLGRLDDIFSKTQTGYYFTMPIADAFNGILAYTDGCSGKLWLRNFQSGFTEQEVCLFNVQLLDSVLKSTAALRYTDNYFEPYFRVFNRYIESLKLDECGIHCIIRHGKSALKDIEDNYEYVLVSYKGTVLNRSMLYFEQGDKVLTVGLGKNNSDYVFPYYMGKRGKQFYLKRMYTPKR